MQASRGGARSSAAQVAWRTVLAATWLALAGCGEEPVPDSIGNPAICRHPGTGQCSPCPGAKLCVHPTECVIITCASADVTFGTPDTADAGGDAKTGDVDEAGETSGAPDATDATDVADATDATDVADATDALDAVDATPEVGDAGPCQNGQKKCLGNHVQVCLFGAWKDEQICAAGQACANGACGCADPCPALNLVECLPGVPALRTCQLTADKCLTWGTPTACAPGQICELGQCKQPCSPACAAGQVCSNGACTDAPCSPACAAGQVCKAGQCVTQTTGTLSCAQVTACIGQTCTVPGDTGCKDGCLAKGTAAAQTQYQTLSTCAKATCKPLADAGKVHETLFCIYSYCAAEQTACLGSGNGTCEQLNACLNDCGSSAVCFDTCNAAASQQGALDFYGLMTCVDDKCAGLGGDAQLACAQQGCKTAFDKCFGAAGGGLTCAGILQCAGGCGTKECAQACKAKGSTQGQAALQALLDCQQLKCGAWCNSGDPQCDPCTNTYCAGEWAACK